MPARKVAVIGMGTFGRVVAESLAEAGAEVIAIDNNMAAIEAVKDVVTYAVRCDATDPRMLRDHNVDEMDAVVVTMGDNFESLVLTVQELLLMRYDRKLCMGELNQVAYPWWVST
ncbi:MAG: UPF0146 family protein, partial [Candidatus Poribacteria bacterium]|nr:UPF0146 family protein [Candidatus Poribacteria bacterium]